jgi:hypothetical protein
MKIASPYEHHQGAIMYLRFSTWAYAVASVALVATAFAVTAPRDSVAVAQSVDSAVSVEASQDAAAGITFKIVPADVMSKAVSWTPLTGDGSN